MSHNSNRMLSNTLAALILIRHENEQIYLIKK